MFVFASSIQSLRSKERTPPRDPFRFGVIFNYFDAELLDDFVAYICKKPAKLVEHIFVSFRHCMLLRIPSNRSPGNPLCYVFLCRQPKFAEWIWLVVRRMLARNKRVMLIVLTVRHVERKNFANNYFEKN